MLHLRAELLAVIRDFFRHRSVLEVETPCLESMPASDPQIEPIEAGDRYLRTSPEFSMKRLLAANSGDIYQIARVFRANEVGALHNPEFTMLEWYRCGWNYRRLMGETDELLHQLFSRHRALPDSEFVTLREIFIDTFELDPWNDNAAAHIAKAHAHGFPACDHRIDALDFLMDTIARTRFSEDRLTFVSDYPPESALFAHVAQGVAERFEVYLGAVELVNGYTELTDVSEYRRRFLADNDRRPELGKPRYSVNEAWFDTFETDLPDCAGASLGIDRALMCVAGALNVSATLAFDWTNA